MQGLLLNINMILAQTQLQKNLTFIHVSLFVFFLMMLVIDSRGAQKMMSNKTINKIVLTLFIVAGVALAILYFVL